MNLLPIPALDGGRALFLVFEGIFKKRIPIKIEAVINSIGFALLLGLMAIVLCQDIFKIMVR
jgi:regulator of sigma E protease